VHVPDPQIGWLPYAVSAGRNMIEGWKPDLIFASAMPYTSLLCASSLAKRSGIPWVAELRDLWTDNTYYPHPPWRKKLERHLERSVLSTAAGLVTVSTPLTQILEEKYAPPTATVLNGFDEEDYPLPHEMEEIGASGDDCTLWISFTGRIYEGKRDPSPLFEAMQHMGPDAKRVRCLFYGHNMGGVRAMAERYGVEDQVVIHDPVPYKEALRIQCQSDILLLLLWNDPREQGIYTGKLFEYIGAHRPILTLGWKSSAAAQLIQQREVGVVLNDPLHIAEQLKEWLRVKELHGAISAPSGKGVEEFSRREQTRGLERFLLHLHSRHAQEDRSRAAVASGVSLER
jgi:hypothetical protein